MALGGAPPGLVGYFYAAACPTGWLAANGTNGTPDMRGVFVRGKDNGRGLDPGRTIASYQGDAIRNITGSFDVWGTKRWYASGAFAIERTEQWWDGGDRNNGSPSAYSFDASRQVPTAHENRPVNVALLACIKE